MIKIKVTGTGLIPRGYGIAPRLTPFEADIQLIKSIMNTPGLKVYMVNPINSKSVEATKENIDHLYDVYEKGVVYQESKKPEQPTVHHKESDKKPNTQLKVLDTPNEKN